MAPRHVTGRLCAVAAALALLASAPALVAVPAAGAGDTDVHLRTGVDRLGVGERTAVEVVVADVDGGVGAYDVTLSVADGGAIITDVAVAENADLTRVDVAEDGSSAHLVVALMETPDTGTATIATASVEGTSAGRSDLDASVTELADESGETYDVQTVEGTPLTVVGDTTTPRGPSTPAATADSSDRTSGSAGAADAPTETPVELDAPADTVVSVVGGWRVPVAVALAVTAFAVVFGAFVRRR
jgi:hypothetical protein